MIRFQNTEVVGWEAAIRGMRNPMNSWEKSDSNLYNTSVYYDDCNNRWENNSREFEIGQKDLDLMKRLRNAGTDHRKFMRMIVVYVDITAPLYWWKEFDTYKVGTVANSCSTMHKIHEKEFTLEDFSCEHLIEDEDDISSDLMSPSTHLDYTIRMLNTARYRYLETKEKKYWWQMIQLLPTSYNQKRTVMLNYEVLANIYKSRKCHKLDEWKVTCADNIEELEAGFGFCDWIRTLPYSELITSGFEEE